MAASAASATSRAPPPDDAATRTARRSAPEGAELDDESTGGGGGGGGSGRESDGEAPILLDRLKVWLQQAVDEAMKLDGPQYDPSQGRFGGSVLDEVQLGALCRLIGTSGMDQLGEVLLDAAIQPAAALKGFLGKHREALSSVAMGFERSRDLHVELAPQELHALLSVCRSYGIAVVGRRLFMRGTRTAKEELAPPAVTSFVHGLGEQQLPSGRPAGPELPSVASLLASFGMVPGSHADEALIDGAAARCGIRDDASDWVNLPYALALTLFLPEWEHAYWAPRLALDSLGGNAHCIVHGFHALLCMVEPHMPSYTHGPLAYLGRDGWSAHRIFLAAAALVLRRRRLAVRECKASEIQAKERSLASVVLVLEHFVQLADPLGYGDLERALPYSALALPCYAVISQPATTATPDAALAALDVSDAGEAPEASSGRSRKVSMAARMVMGPAGAWWQAPTPRGQRWAR